MESSHKRKFEVLNSTSNESESNSVEPIVVADSSDSSEDSNNDQAESEANEDEEYNFEEI